MTPSVGLLATRADAALLGLIVDHVREAVPPARRAPAGGAAYS
jgi:hypothetical protein